MVPYRSFGYLVVMADKINHLLKEKQVYRRLLWNGWIEHSHHTLMGRKPGYRDQRQ
jgi:hypothetical protein